LPLKKTTISIPKERGDKEEGKSFKKLSEERVGIRE